MKKILCFIVFAILAISPISVAASNEISNEEDVLISNKELKKDELLSEDYQFETITIEGRKIKEPKFEVESILEDKFGEEIAELTSKKATQLLKVKKNKKNNDLTAEFVTVAEIGTQAVATDSQSHSNWIGNTKGTVTVYYHIDTKSGLADSVDMNYIYVSWSPQSGTIISNRSATMYEDGKSHWGSGIIHHSKTVYPTTNSSTKYDVPDSWEPIWEGLLGARSQATVVQGGLSYTLKVDCRITPKSISTII
ncbi:hypothetical protein [Cytobacillus firmus]|uniref:hypothetical protein n=1 Tax=Cytobacillus firmus TaxID=1399 RepID=UPI0024C1D202|nr:hypothetical protein [Cytobacillus firmus]WHY59899.1 hypothetical protein QNH42_15045 [Cytobacillus firmus]